MSDCDQRCSDPEQRSFFGDCCSARYDTLWCGLFLFLVLPAWCTVLLWFVTHYITYLFLG